MGGLPPLPVELRRGVSTASEPSGALAGWTSTDHIGIAVPDLTRALPLQDALQTLFERLPNRQVVIGLGLHRPLRDPELALLNDWNPIQHDPDDCVPTMEIMGIPGGIHRRLAKADWCISVGVCELHQYAGLSGGHKGLSVGCASRESIAALHHRDFFTQPGVEVGRIQGNPFRDAVDLLGRAAGCHLALNWVPSLGLWMAGSPERVIREALRRMQPWEAVSRAAPGARIRVPSSKTGSFYQASRAATYLALSPSPPLQEGAIIALEARCEEGLGSEAGFIQALESHAPPWSGLLEGVPPVGAGAQRAVMLALLARRYRLRVHGCARPEELIDRGIQATREPAPLEPGWLDIEAPFDRLPQLEVAG